MSAAQFTTPVANLGEINNRLFRLAAQVHAALALVESDENFETSRNAQSTAFLLERTEDDLRVLADQVDQLFLRGADHD